VPSAYKGFGLGLAVEVLAALLSGARCGPAPEALAGDGTPGGRDDDIGWVVAAIAPATLRSENEYARDAESLFGTLLACPPVECGSPVRYPGWLEAERAGEHRRHGVPLEPAVYEELEAVALSLGLRPPAPVQAP
jgi:LDH2 family malate/lactate/ureidoglycolate dehydrogenase